MVSMVQMKALRSARQSASPVTEGSELGLGQNCLRADLRNGYRDDNVAQSQVGGF